MRDNRRVVVLALILVGIIIISITIPIIIFNNNDNDSDKTTPSGGDEEMRTNAVLPITAGRISDEVFVEKYTELIDPQWGTYLNFDRESGVAGCPLSDKIRVHRRREECEIMCEQTIGGCLGFNHLKNEHVCELFVKTECLKHVVSKENRVDSYLRN